jgi:hypothetical protein
MYEEVKLNPLKSVMNSFLKTLPQEEEWGKEKEIEGLI